MQKKIDYYKMNSKDHPAELTNEDEFKILNTENLNLQVF